MPSPSTTPSPARRSALTPLSALALAALLGACAAPGGGGAPGSAGFYGTPSSMPAKPGQMLRQEPLDSAASLTDASRSLRVLYTSTDGVKGQGIVPVSGAVYFPRTPEPPGGWPVIAWAHGTTGVGDTCAPSRMPRTPRDREYLNTWLREGFVVVATDYQGLGTDGPHPYLHTRAQAYSVLDAVRAALSLPGVANKVVLVGQSQGGGAAFGTAGIAPAYAPDVKLLGTVATGTPYLGLRPPENPTPSDKVSPQMAYSMYATVTAKLVQPDFDPASVFLPAAMPSLAASGETCVGAMFNRLTAEQRSERNSFQPGGITRLFTAIGPVTGYATLKLAQPVFMGIGGADIDVPTAMQQKLAQDACKAGAPVQAQVYPGLDHSGAVNGSLKDSMPFVRSLLAGQPVKSNCGS